MTLFVDKIMPNHMGGITNDIKKAEYILAVHKITFQEILNKAPKKSTPSVMFGSKQFVIALNMERDLSYVNLGLINYKIDLEKNFNFFADCFSPKAVQGFYQTQQKLIKKNKFGFESFDLSNNDSDFVIAYGNFIEHRNN